MGAGGKSPIFQNPRTWVHSFTLFPQFFLQSWGPAQWRAIVYQSGSSGFHLSTPRKKGGGRERRDGNQEEKRGRKKRRERGKERRKRGRGKRVTSSVLGRPTDGYIFSDRRNRLSVLQCPSNRTSFQSSPACSIQRKCHRDRSRVTPIGYRHGMTVHSLGTWPVFRTVSNCPPLSSLPPMTRV